MTLSEVTGVAIRPADSALLPFQATPDNCDQEPIHNPGSIQPHGALVAFAPGSGRVLHASANLGLWLPVGDLPARGQFVPDFLGVEAFASVVHALSGAMGGVIRHQIVDLPARPAQGQAVALDAVVHLHRGACIAEFEPVSDADQQIDWMQAFSDAVDALRSAGDFDELISRSAQRVKRMTGFDRVMVYRFDSDWNGHVIADAHEAGMESFYDLHYPASDIPAQARELYRSNLVRYIANVAYTPVSVKPWLDGERGLPLDMSHAMLRSVSPMHLRYLSNMGIASTLTISVLVEGRLWGLIACHHRTPHPVPVRLRRACHALSVTVGYMVGWHEQRERAAATVALMKAQESVVEAFNQLQAPLGAVIEQCSAALLRTASARSGVFWRDSQVIPFGQWPEGEQGDAMLAFARRSLETSTVDVFSTETGFPPLPHQAEPTSAIDVRYGYMAVRLDAFASSGIVWVRPEIRREVSWGGDPDKPMQVELDAEGRQILSPRSSFARWLTVVKGRCRAWSDLDLQAAHSMLALVPVLTVRESLSQVRVSDERFRSLVTLQSDAYWQLDIHGRIVTLSKALPTGRGQLEGQTLVEIFAASCSAAELAKLQQALDRQLPFRDLRLQGLAEMPSGPFIIELGGEPLKDPHGRITGWHGTITDATNAVAVQTALRLKEAAEMSNLSKSKFMSQMSHELRTPLNAVLGFSQLLLMDDSVSPIQRDKIQHIKNAGDWLLEMIGDLMDLSRIETGNLKLNVQAVDIGPVVAETLSMVQSQATVCGVLLFNELRRLPIWVVADKSRLKQVLVNLASNALKYNKRDGEVRVSATVDASQGTTRIAVHDSGVGLTAKQIGELFQPFNRLGRENQRIQGTGIGLVIAKQLVEAMGGHIVVESELGRGSVFSVVLKTASPPAAEPAKGTVAEADLNAQVRTVLYVGDDATNLVLVEAIVESMPGVRLVHAETAERALELSRHLAPAVVLIDIKLSGLPGMHLLKSIKEDPALRHLRCIAVDASFNGEALDDLSLAGFEDRWRLPIDLKMIASGLKSVLSP